MFYKFKAYKYKKAAVNLILRSPLKYSHDIQVIDLEGQTYYLVVEKEGRPI